MMRTRNLPSACTAIAALVCICQSLAAQPQEFHVNTKGSIFIIPSLELRWDSNSNLIQDTYIHLHNDFPAQVNVQMYFVNGDPPLPANGNERAHPGWNRADLELELTSNQPMYWSLSTGTGAPSPIIFPFTILDPGFPPGRPDPEGSSDRVLRGYVVGWAVNNDGKEIRWNHLEATATVVNFSDGGAWGYNGYHSQSVDPNVLQGQETGTPGVLNMDNVEFAAPYDKLMFNFAADNSSLYSATTAPITVRSDLTLMPVGVDLRQDNSGPVITKADFRVWNMNEVAFTGMFKCVNCWDQTTFAQYGVPNHFPQAVLQTPVGWAEVDGIASQLCEQTPGESQDAALVGVLAKQLDIDFITEYAGYNLFGRGSEPAVIRWDVIGGPPTRSTSSDDAAETSTTEVSINLAAHTVDAQGPKPRPADNSMQSRGVNAIDLDPGSRMSASKPGNLVYISKIDLRWDSQGVLRRDTFVHLTNWFSDPVKVRMYFVNGDDAIQGEPGWNNLEVELDLTPRQPVYWSASRGDASLGIPSFIDLDPGPPPGRPDIDLYDRMLRGFIVAWAVDESCEEIAGNVLMGDAIIVDHSTYNTAWGYNGYHLPNIAAVPFGEPSGTPGVLEMNRLEYPLAFSQLTFVGPASFSQAYNVGQVVVDTLPDVTLHQLSGDFTPNSPGPLKSKANYHVWNQNETKFAGMFRCVTCWDQTFLTNYDIPQHFEIATLQTPVGAARIDGLASILCDNPAPLSVAAAMQGLLANFIAIDAGNTTFAWAGHQMFGAGMEDAEVKGNLCPPCPWDIADPIGPGMDGQVNVFDLLLLLANWNTNGPGAAIAPDVNIVNVFDLLELLANWGPCP